MSIFKYVESSHIFWWWTGCFNIASIQIVFWFLFPCKAFQCPPGFLHDGSILRQRWLLVAWPSTMLQGPKVSARSKESRNCPKSCQNLRYWVLLCRLGSDLLGVTWWDGQITCSANLRADRMNCPKIELHPADLGCLGLNHPASSIGDPLHKVDPNGQNSREPASSSGSSSGESGGFVASIPNTLGLNGTMENNPFIDDKHDDLIWFAY